MDETHYRSRDFYVQRSYAPKGQRAPPAIQSRDASTYSVTLLLDPTNAETPVYFSSRQSSNDQVDWLAFLVDAIASGRIRRGDWLVIDNATVHSGLAIQPALIDALDIAGAHLVYLPTYSPELNPCEYAFQTSKQFLRQQRHPGYTLQHEIIRSYVSISLHTVLGFYQRIYSITQPPSP
jgi:transposase